MGAVCMVGAALSYVVLYTCARALSGRCDWRLTALVRTAANFALMVAWARARGIPLRFSTPRLLWLRSGAGAASLLFAFYALPLLPVADSLTLSNTAPLWIAVLASIFLGERAGPSVWGAIAVGFAGVVIMERPQLEAGLLPVGAALLGAFCAAVAMLGLRRMRGVDPVAIVAHFAGFGMCAVLAVALPQASAIVHSVRQGPATWFLLAGVGLSGTAAQLLITRAYALAPAARNAPMGFAEIGFGALVDRVFFHRVFTGSSLFGMALVLLPAGWLLASARPAKVLQSPFGA